MSPYHKARKPYAASRPQRTTAELRLDWIAAIDLSQRLARIAVEPEATEIAGFGQGLTRLAVLLRSLTPENFCVSNMAANSMVRAWLVLARDFVDNRSGPETRTACAAFLLAGSLSLESILVEQTIAAAGVTRRIMGERD